MPAQVYKHDLECDVCGEILPCIEFTSNHDEHEPHNSVAVCVACLIDAVEMMDGTEDTDDGD